MEKKKKGDGEHLCGDWSFLGTRCLNAQETKRLLKNPCEGGTNEQKLLVILEQSGRF